MLAKRKDLGQLRESEAGTRSLSPHPVFSVILTNAKEPGVHPPRAQAAVLSLSEEFLPLLVRGEVGAIPIAPGEVNASTPSRLFLHSGKLWSAS